MTTWKGNYAYIDANNVYRGITTLGWHIDWKRFRRFLKDRHGVERAYIFLGFIKQHIGLYRDLERWGYTLIFKPVVITSEKNPKGNCDAELVLQVMIDICPDTQETPRKIIIATGDGDFACLIRYLESKEKLKIVLSPQERKCSILLKKATARITYLEEMQNKLAHHDK